MTILENIGLVEEILSKGTIMEGVDIHVNQRQVGSIDMSLKSPITRYPFPFLLSQTDVEAAFEHVLSSRGGRVEWESEVIKIQPSEDYVLVCLKNGEELRSRFVVGCDGAHSFVRHSQPDWKFEGHPVNLLWAQCDGTIADTRIHTTRSAFFIGPSGLILTPF